MRKYLVFARVGFAVARVELGELLVRILFFFVIFGVFSALWCAVVESGMSFGVPFSTLVWYLAVMEWVLLSAFQVHFDIEVLVCRGDVVVELGCLVLFVGARFAEAIGALAAWVFVLLVAVVGVAVFYIGGGSEASKRLLWVVPFGLAAVVTFVALNLMFGLFVFWFGDIVSLHWVVQKLGFVLGGLMLPFELYPRVLVCVAEFMLFLSLLYGPVVFLLGECGDRVGVFVLSFVFWFVVFAVVLLAFFERVCREFELNGG